MKLAFPCVNLQRISRLVAEAEQGQATAREGGDVSGLNSGVLQRERFVFLHLESLPRAENVSHVLRYRAK